MVAAFLTVGVFKPLGQAHDELESELIGLPLKAQPLTPAHTLSLDQFQK